MSVPSSSFSVSLLSSISPSFPLLEGFRLLEWEREEGALREDIRVWEPSSGAGLNDTKEDDDAIEWIGVRLRYSPRGTLISPCGQI